MSTNNSYTAEKNKNVQELKKVSYHKQTLGYLGKNSFHVSETALIGDVADELNSMDMNIKALAVVDIEMKVKGLITASDLFSYIGRQFGRAILGNRMIRHVSDDFTAFDYRRNIFEVEQKLGKVLEESNEQYFILADENMVYKGIFSSRDLLIYLSNITRMDISLARKLQSKISKEEISVHELKFDLIASTQAAKGVGGDYYSLKKTHGDNWVISVCDVSGKGISASLLTTTIWGMMSIYPFNKGLPPFLYKVNNYIFNTFESMKFITGVFLDFNANTGEVDICDMGHSYIYIYRSEKFTQLEQEGNMPIGVAPSSRIKVSRIKLKPGDILFIPTDGLFEQENIFNELFKPGNIKAILNQNIGRPIEEINDKIKRCFLEFRGDKHMHDDVTYLLLHYYEE